MKLTFPLPTDSQIHTFCPNCHAEAIKTVKTTRGTSFVCNQCGQTHERIIQIGPNLNWWVDPKTQELWHESAGIIIINETGRLLVFNRLIYPRQTTFPAGHVKSGESPIDATKREAHEEVGLTIKNPELIGSDIIPGDSCSRGADFHRWHLYRTHIHSSATLNLTSDEGRKAAWLTLDELRAADTPPAVRYMIKTYGPRLISTS